MAMKNKLKLIICDICNSKNIIKKTEEYINSKKNLRKNF